MIVLAVCTEGNSSEPNYIEALKNVLLGTIPSGNAMIEVVPVPLGGNQGFKKIFEKADAELVMKVQDSRNILSVLDQDDVVEKWLIVDYDKMHKRGVSEDWMRKEAVRNDYKLVINKPNFEFFVLAHFIPIVEVAMVSMKDLEGRINAEVDRYNRDRNFDKSEFSALRLPKYSKGSFQSKELFWKLLDQNVSLLSVFDKERCCYDDEHYTEMWRLIERLREILGRSDVVEK